MAPSQEHRRRHPVPRSRAGPLVRTPQDRARLLGPEGWRRLQGSRPLNLTPGPRPTGLSGADATGPSAQTETRGPEGTERPRHQDDGGLAPAPTSFPRGRQPRRPGLSGPLRLEPRQPGHRAGGRMTGRTWRPQRLPGRAEPSSHKPTPLTPAVTLPTTRTSEPLVGARRQVGAWQGPEGGRTARRLRSHARQPWPGLGPQAPEGEALSGGHTARLPQSGAPAAPEGPGPCCPAPAGRRVRGDGRSGWTGVRGGGGWGRAGEPCDRPRQRPQGHRPRVAPSTVHTAEDGAAETLR